MSLRQILLVALAVVIVVIVFFTGQSFFQAQKNAANRNAIVQEIHALGEDAFHYFARPASLAGGGGSYLGYAIPKSSAWGPDNINASYEITAITPGQIVFTATSKLVENSTVIATFDRSGNLLTDPVIEGF